MMSQEIYLLDLIGTFAFAAYGSYFALESDFDIFGIFVSAFLTAVGGGIIRDLVLNKIPKIMHNDFYASVALLLGLIYGLAGAKMTNLFWANLLIVACLIIRWLAITNKITLWKPKKI